LIITAVALCRFCEDDARHKNAAAARHARAAKLRARQNHHELKNQIVPRRSHRLGHVVAYVCGSKGGALRDAQLVQFPVTVGVWAIFVLLFVKLK